MGRLETSECTIDHVRVRVWRGPGFRRRLLLHGFAGHPELWEGVVTSLSQAGVVLAPFLPGHGGEALPKAWRSFEEVVAGLADVVRAFACEGWQVAGYSLGARLALGLAQAAPELWSELVLVGVQPGLAGEDERRARREVDAARARVLRERGVREFVDQWEQLPLFASQKRLSASLQARQRRWRESHDPEGLAWALATLSPGAMPNYWPALPSLAKPVCLVAGELDPHFCQLASRAAALVPAGRVVVVPGVGHNVVLEAPEAIARLLETEEEV